MSEGGTRPATPGGTSSAPPSRALLVLDRPGSVRDEERPLAGFVAQLIACRRGLPAFRTAGRERPAVARESYAQASTRRDASARLVAVV